MKKNEYIIHIPESNHYVLHLKLNNILNQLYTPKTDKKPP